MTGRYNNEVFGGMLNYLFQKNRLATFKNWIYDNDKPCSAIKMSEAGFIFEGNSVEPDAVMCFFCGKSLDGWEENDDPWKEHLSHAPNCDFAKIQKPEGDFTVEEFLNLKASFFIKCLERKREQKKQEIFNYYQKLIDAVPKK